MLIEGNIPNRQKDEKLILFLRRHPIILVGKWLLYLLLATIPILLYFFLSYTYPQILESKISYPFLFLLASVYYLYVLLFLFNAYIDYQLDVWIVTNQRIINIEQKGLFNREIAEHSLERIQDVSGLQKGIFETFFSYGDVHVQTAGEIQRFIFRQVDNPFEVVRVINGLIQKKELKFEEQLADKIKQEE